jgi:MFS family permease
MSSPIAPSLRQVATAASGNFLEMYDFMVFGFYAPALSKLFFPQGNEFSALMLALSTFGAGFLMRPIGAIILGVFLDKYGRRRGLLLTLGLMAIGTATITVVPSYARIGLAAPLLILIGRLVQGFSAGVEVGGVSVYLYEIAPPARRGFFVAWQSSSQQAAVVFAAVLGIGLSETLSPAAMAAWGWRIPFATGCLLIPFLFIARRRLIETPVFKARTRVPNVTELLRGLSGAAGVVTLGMLLTTMTTVSFYLITSYTPTFGTAVLKLSPAAALTVTMCVGLSNFVLLPVMGALSDRIGRHPLLIGATLMSLATSYPAMLWLVSAPSFERLLVVELWLSLIYATYNGALVVLLSEMMPSDVRTSGSALAYSLATAIFGGFTPAICTYLIHATGNKAMPGMWVSGAALIALVAGLLSRKLKPTGTGDKELLTTALAPPEMSDGDAR